MLNGLIQTEAIVLRTFRLAEADKIVVALGAQTGMVRGVARGARRLKNRFGAALEVWTIINLEFFAKEQRELVSVRTAEIVETSFNLASDDQAVMMLDYLSELLIGFVPAGEPNPKLYRMARACLSALHENPQQAFALGRYFEVWLLKLSGFLPSFTQCQQCGREFDGKRSVAVGAQGTLVCLDCAPRAASFISVGALGELRLIREAAPNKYLRQTVATANREVSEWTRELIERVLERRLEDKQPLSRDYTTAAQYATTK